MRNVARDAGVSLAALQHYFPTLQSLVSALLDDLVATYSDEIRSIPDVASEDAINRFDALVTFYLVDSKSEHRRRLFAELWALALRDATVAKAMDEMTSIYQGRFERAIAGVNPGLSRAQLKRRARLIIAQIDGLNQYVLPGTRDRVSLKSLERDARKQILAVAVSP